MSEFDRILNERLTASERELIGGRLFACLMMGLLFGFVMGTITGALAL